MNREIKFRAWHTKANKMFSPEEIDQLTIMTDGKGFINVSGTHTKLSVLITEMIPLQYTGLKDKSGKVIIYDQKRAAFCLFTKEDNIYVQLLNTVTVDLEIIGNSYETPNLLQR